LCGSPSILDLPPFLLFLNATHSTRSIYLSIAKSTSSTGSFGIREVILTFYNEPIPTRPVEHPTCSVAPYNLNAFSGTLDYSCPCDAPLTMPLQARATALDVTAVVCFVAVQALLVVLLVIPRVT